MRTRHEVLREFGVDELARLLPPVVAEQVHAMADRIRELEARVDDEQKYVVTLHRMIEAHCRGERVNTSDSPHIAAMLNANLSEAASEPVAWADRLADAVRKLVRVLNDGDDVSALVLALEATEKALAQFDDSKRCCGLCDAGECKYEIAPPSAAGVTVTEAMVDAVVRFLYRHFDIILNRDGATKMLTAALQNAASEGASAS